MKSNKNNSGITILEIMIVVAMVGIIAAIATPNLSGWAASRVVKQELASIEALIDYGKKTSVSKSRKLYLRLTNPNTLQLFQLRLTPALAAENSNNTNCVFSAANTEPISEYPNPSIFESTINTQHNNLAQIGQNQVYPNTASLMCFFSNGSSTGGGFQITNNASTCYQFRTNIWITGFYANQINTNTSCVGPANWIERN